MLDEEGVSVTYLLQHAKSTLHKIHKQRFCSLVGSQAVNKSAQSEDCSASELALASVEAGESPVSWTSHMGVLQALAPTKV